MVTLPPIAPGMVINDRYEIKQSLGKGGMGEVFLAHDRTALQAVALKIVREESRASEEDKEALRKELLLARSVSHPNVCRVHDLVPSAYGPIIVMEHIVGQTLHTHIRRKKAQGGYTPDEFRRLAQDICSGVAAIHQQGLVHGDLKPGNVMVTASHDGGIGKGIASSAALAAARRAGCDRTLVAVSGDVAAGAPPRGRDGWQVAIESGLGSLEPCVVWLRESALSTSGDAEQVLVHGGQRHSHIVDPRTGRAVNHSIAPTVWSTDPAVADAAATSLSVLGVREMDALCERIRASGVQVEMRVAYRETPDGPVLVRATRGFPACMDSVDRGREPSAPEQPPESTPPAPASAGR